MSKKSKLFVVLFTILILTIGLVGCTNNTPNSSPDSASNQTTTIKFMVNGDLYFTLTANSSNIKLPDNPTSVDDKLVFEGWYEDSEYVKVFSLVEYLASPNRKDITVYAKFVEQESIVKHTITFNTNGANENIDPIEFTVGSVLSLPVPKKDGYKFINWLDNSGNVYNNTSTMPDNDLTLIAKWEIIVGSFNDDYVYFQPATQGTKLDELEKEYYRNLGVDEFLYVEMDSTAVGGRNKVGQLNNFDLSKKVNMEYKPKKGYVLTWYKEDFSNVNGAQLFTLNYGSNIQLLTVTDKDNSIKRRYLVDLYILHDFKVNIYDNITSNEIDSEVWFKENERIDETLLENKNSIYEFDKWLYFNTEVNKYLEYDFDIVQNSNLNLYASYKPVELNVNLDGGELTEKVTIIPYEGNQKLLIPKKVGYDFIGYQANFDGVDKYITDQEGKVNVNILNDVNTYRDITAKYIIKQYEIIEILQNDSVDYFKIVKCNLDIIYTNDKNEEISEIKPIITSTSGLDLITYGEIFVLPELRTGYVTEFIDEQNKLFKNSDNSLFNYDDGQNIRINQFFANNITLTLNYMNGEENSTIVQKTNSDLTLPTPVREGFKFEGWYTNSNPYLGSITNYTKMPSYNNTIYAVWTDSNASDLKYSYDSDLEIINAYAKNDVQYDSIRVPSLYKNLKVNIPYKAYDNQIKLKELYIPENIDKVSSNLFHANAYPLIYCEDKTQKTSWADNWMSNNEVVWDCKNNDVTNKDRIYTYVDGVRYYINGNAGYVARQFTDVKKDINIPALISYKDELYNVLFVDDQAFINCDIHTFTAEKLYKIYSEAFKDNINLTKVEIKNDLSFIATKVFYNCSKLNELYLPSTVSTIRNDSLQDTNITRLQIPANLLNYVDTSKVIELTLNGQGSIPNNLLKNKDTLQKLTFSEGITKISENAFSDCTTLQTVVFPKSLVEIGNSAFSDCNILNNVTYADDCQLNIIGQYAFAGCSSLGTVKIPSKVTNVYQYAFSGVGVNAAIKRVEINDLTAWLNIDFYGYDANPLTCIHTLYLNGEEVTNVNIPQGITEIKSYAFNYLTNLTSVVLPETLITIGEYAFSKTNIDNIVIPNNVTSIKANAFNKCIQLSAITIPAKTSTIGDYAFFDCSNLKIVNFDSDSVNKTFGDSVFSSNINKVNINNIEDWFKFSFAGVYSNPLAIAKNLYVNDVLLEELNVPSTVENINDFAFANSTLKKVNIPNTVKTIGNNAFMGTTNLTDISLPGIFTNIGLIFDGYDSYNRINKGLNNINNITITSGINLDNYALSNITGKYKNLYLPSTIESFGNNVFSGSRFTIYVTQASKPSSWLDNWNCNCPVVWNYGGESGITDDGFSWVLLNDDTINITNYKNVNNSNIVTIPEEINGHQVSQLSSMLLAYQNNIEELTIPGTINNIGANLLYGADNLKKITTPILFNKFKELFSNNPNDFKVPISLAEIVLTDSNTIPTDYFDMCSSITSVTIPNTLKNIESKAFYDTTNLTTVNVPDLKTWLGITFNGLNANPTYIAKKLYINGQLLTELVLDADVTTIKDYAFANCIDITKIVLPKTVTSIGLNSFYKCNNVTSIELPMVVTSLGDIFDYNKKVPFPSKLTNVIINNGNIKQNSFINENNITNITLTGNTQIIENAAFYQCNKLTSITFNNLVESIGDNAFAGCSELTTIQLPKSLKTLGNNVFFNCINLNNIIFEKGILITAIPTSAFEGCQSLINITLPSTITTAGSKAFKDCINLTTITFPSSNIDINTDLFYGCEKLENVNSLNTNIIPNNAFNGCINLVNLDLLGKISIIGNSAFENCTKLAYVIQDGLTSIGSNAFMNCKSITDINIPDSVTDIGNLAFEGCTSLTKVKITNKLIKQGIGLESCPITDLEAHIDTIPGNLINKNTLVNVIISGGTSIPNHKFSGNTSIKNVTISDSITIIDEYAFNSCTSLNTINFHDYLTDINRYAFYNCTELVNININKLSSIKNICEYSFDNCSKLKKFFIPVSCTFVSKEAFINTPDLIILLDGENVNVNWSKEWNKYNHKVVFNSDGTSGEIDGITWAGLNDHTINIVDVSDALTNITIPSIIDNRNVAVLNDGLFLNSTVLENITLPDTLNKINKQAFYGCTKLAKIRIPMSVYQISNEAFGMCTNLNEVEFDAGMSFGINLGTNIFTGSAITKISLPLFIKQIGLLFGGYTGSPLKNTGVSAITDVIVLENELNTIMYEDFLSNTSVKNVTLPNNITEIRRDVFEFCSELININLPNSLTVIPDDMFFNCTKLKNIVLPLNVESIGVNAFAFTDIENITLPSTLNTLGSGAFSGCSYLNSITIPEGVKEIDKQTFDGCTRLSNVSFNNSLSIIGNKAFNNCKSLTNMTIPNTVTSIGDYAFNECFNIRTFVIKTVSVLKHIGSYAFSGCTNLEEIILPISMETTGDYVFNKCQYLTIYCEAKNKPTGFGDMWIDGSNTYSVIWDYPNNTNVSHDGNLYEKINGIKYQFNPSTKKGIIMKCYNNTDETININGTVNISGQEYSITEIQSEAFMNVDQVLYITIPNTITKIGSKAFYSCDNLRKIKIPSSVQNMDIDVFTNSLNVVIKCEAQYRPSYWSDTWNASKCPVIWDCNNNTVANDGYAYEYLNNLFVIRVKDNVSTLHDLLDDSITELNFPLKYNINGSDEYITGVSTNVFSKCNNLKKVNINDLKLWCDIQFANETANPITKTGKLYLNDVLLTSLDIPQGTTEIHNSAFNNLLDITSITIPNSVTKIGDRSFINCKNVETVSFAQDSIVSSIGHYAFYNCFKIIDINLPNNLQTIGNYSFYNCERIPHIVIPNSVNSIGNNAFDCCSLLNIYFVASTLPTTSYDWNRFNCRVTMNYDAASEYTYTFNSEGGTVIDPVTIAGIYTLPIPEKEGYYFDGWYRNDLFVDRYTEFAGSNATFIAHWILVDGYYDGSTLEKAITIKKGDKSDINLSSQDNYRYYKYIPTDNEFQEIQVSKRCNIYVYDETGNCLYNETSRLRVKLYSGSTYYICIKSIDDNSYGKGWVKII